MKIIARGAEAVLYLDKFDSQKALVKDRVKKGYRIPELDERIRKLRTRGEENLLRRARRFGINTPRVFDSEKSKLVMEFVEGERIKDVLSDKSPKDREFICKLIGETIAKLHEAGIIHGDLTTSNMILKGKKLFLIDFGLGKMSKSVEDQATDLYLLYEAVRATHFKVFERCWKNIINTYTHNYTSAKQVLARFEKIKTRRRYKK